MRLLVVSPDSGRLEALRLAASQHQPVSSLAILEGSLATRAGASINNATDVILIDATRDAMDELDALERIQETMPEVQAIVLASAADPKILLRALRLGVKEVLTPDTIEAELETALRRVQAATSMRSDEKAKTFVFASAKGGSGGTFLAANFAYNLAVHTQARVLLMDLDLRGGNAHLMLTERKPLVTLADLSREIHRVDASFLESSMIDILPNFGILTAPEDTALVNEVRAAHIETLLAMARTNFDYVVVDIGRSLTPVTIRAIDVADYVFPVCQLSVPFIREARRLVISLKSLDLLPAKIKLLVNRHEKVRDLTLADLEKAVGVDVSATIPNDYKAVTESVNHGNPLSKVAKSSPTNKAINRLVHEVTGNGVANGGWFSRMLKR